MNRFALTLFCSFCFVFYAIENGHGAEKQKTALTPDEVASFNLKPTDFPEGYQLDKKKSGFLNSALQYTKGDRATAKQLEKEGWLAVDRVDYLGANNVYSTLSVYQTGRELDCGMKEAEAVFLKNKGREIALSKKWGQKSLLYLLHVKNAEVGEINFYELRFYYGNVFVNLELRGEKETTSREEIIKYASLIDQRLKKACPRCEKVPVCTHPIK